MLIASHDSILKAFLEFLAIEDDPECLDFRSEFWNVFHFKIKLFSSICRYFFGFNINPFILKKGGPGEQGERGIDVIGASGEPGRPGLDGIPGLPGPRGDIGDDGLFNHFI